jgi:hypothetical protein
MCSPREIQGNVGHFAVVHMLCCFVFSNFSYPLNHSHPRPFPVAIIRRERENCGNRRMREMAAEG